MTVYIVFGETGDRYNPLWWLVAAFPSLKECKEFVKEANAIADKLYKEHPHKFGPAPLVFKTKCDPMMRMDYTGTRYFYEIVTLRDGKALRKLIENDK